MFLFTNFILFIVIWWIIFFISLPIKISVPDKIDVGLATSAPKKTHIMLKVIITSAISLLIMIFFISIKFDLGVIFKQ